MTGRDFSDPADRSPASRKVRIESLAQTLSLVSTVSLEPEPIPLDLKLVLIGDRLLYYLLSALDPDFNELFKVPIDFADDADRTADSTNLYARFLATIAAREQLRVRPGSGGTGDRACLASRR